MSTMNWLLLKGIKMDARHWGKFPAELQRSPHVQYAVAMDPPGAGGQNHQGTPSKIASITAEIRGRWLAHRNANPGPWSIAGLSLGGMIAMSWAEQWPEDFANVVLVNTSAGDLNPPWNRFSFKQLPNLAKAARTQDDEALLRILCQQLDDEGLRDVARQFAQFQVDQPIQPRTVLKQLLAGHRFKAPASLQPPVLILAGAQDQLVDPRCSLALSQRLRAELRVHPHAGHNLSLDAPAWLVQQLESVSAAGASTTMSRV